MDSLGKYDITINGLNPGIQTYEFDLDDAFFSMFPYEDLYGGDGRTEVSLRKGGDKTRLDFTISGTARVACDRCLGECSVPVSFNGTLIVRQCDREEEYDGETLWIPRGEDTVNVARYIFESFVLGMPLRKVHGDDEKGNPQCDPEMLERFSAEPEAEADGRLLGDNPQMDKLRELKDKL